MYRCQFPIARSNAYGWLLLWLAVALAGCSSLGIESTEKKQKMAKVEAIWPYAKDGILIDVESSAELNRHADRAHALVLGVVQLEEEKAFPKMLSDTAVVLQLLSTGKASAGVLQLDRYVLNPGERHLIRIDRVQDARFIGLLAGYYDFEAAGSARHFRIPLNMHSSGLIAKDYKAEPSVLALRLILGSQRIVNAVSLTHDPDHVPRKELMPTSSQPAEIPAPHGTAVQAAPYAGTLIKLGQ